MPNMPSPFTVVSSPFQLTEFWQGLMGAGGFDQTSLWTIFLDEHDRVEPLIIPVDGVPAQPEPDELVMLELNFGAVLDENMLRSAAFLLSRPGPPAMTPSDRAWARALVSLSDPRFRHWPVHLATADQVRVFAPDDLAGAAQRSSRTGCTSTE